MKPNGLANLAGACENHTVTRREASPTVLIVSDRPLQAAPLAGVLTAEGWAPEMRRPAELAQSAGDSDRRQIAVVPLADGVPWRPALRQLKAKLPDALIILVGESAASTPVLARAAGAYDAVAAGQNDRLLVALGHALDLQELALRLATAEHDLAAAQSTVGALTERGAPIQRAPADAEAPVVLVVDDDQVVRLALEATLTAGGFAVTTASNGESALRAIDRQLPTLITLDPGLPGMSGYDVLDRLKDHPRQQDIPVVVVSVGSERTVGFAKGASAYVVKPAHPRHLIRVAQRLVRDRDLPVALVGGVSGDRQFLTRVLRRSALKVIDFEHLGELEATGLDDTWRLKVFLIRERGAALTLERWLARGLSSPTPIVALIDPDLPLSLSDRLRAWHVDPLPLDLDRRGSILAAVSDALLGPSYEH